MTELQLFGDYRTALSHLALFGLGAILEAAGVANVRVGWSDGSDPRPVIRASQIDWPRAAGIVREHALHHVAADDWTAARDAGDRSALMSPRIASLADDAAWRGHVAARWEIIDRVVGEQRTDWLDLRLIGSLGEPAYWRFNRQHQPLPDEGASRWEMKTRNRGEEFVGNRLRPLAERVAARSAEAIESGLTGNAPEDELGKNEVDSRTATGLAAPGPTDNALAWCALWGISQFPVIARIEHPSRTAGHLPAPRRAERDRRGWFYVPVPARPIALPRLRTVIVSDQLAQAAAIGPESPARAGVLDAEAACGWLADRGIAAIVRFPIGEYGSANAPERRALLGTLIPFRVP
jgi:CRISPR-associated protein Csb3